MKRVAVSVTLGVVGRPLRLPIPPLRPSDVEAEDGGDIGLNAHRQPLLPDPIVESGARHSQFSDEPRDILDVVHKGACLLEFRLKLENIFIVHDRHYRLLRGEFRLDLIYHAPGWGLIGKDS